MSQNDKYSVGELPTVLLYEKLEEKANVISHAIGLGFSVLALLTLIYNCHVNESSEMTWISMLVYGLSMILLFAASTTYHASSTMSQRRWLKKADHCAIFLLIAGTYTPFLLVALKTPLAYGMMVVIWCCALLGVLLKSLFIHRFEKLSLVMYLLMGWLSLIVIYQLVLVLPWQSVFWLALGGVTYSVGVIFYACQKIKYNHAVWHVFVLAACAFHFYAIYAYVPFH